MSTKDRKPQDVSDLRNPNNPILDVYGLAALLGISSASIPALRSRTPEKLPPPYLSRPLRWRRETAVRWMDEQERREAIRIKQKAEGADPKAPHRRVRCARPRGHRVYPYLGPREARGITHPFARHRPLDLLQSNGLATLRAGPLRRPVCGASGLPHLSPRLPHSWSFDRFRRRALPGRPFSPGTATS